MKIKQRFYTVWIDSLNWMSSAGRLISLSRFCFSIILSVWLFIGLSIGKREVAEFNSYPLKISFSSLSSLAVAGETPPPTERVLSTYGTVVFGNDASKMLVEIMQKSFAKDKFSQAALKDLTSINDLLSLKRNKLKLNFDSVIPLLEKFVFKNGTDLESGVKMRVGFYASNSLNFQDTKNIVMVGAFYTPEGVTNKKHCSIFKRFFLRLLPSCCQDEEKNIKKPMNGESNVSRPKIIGYWMKTILPAKNGKGYYAKFDFMKMDLQSLPGKGISKIFVPYFDTIFKELNIKKEKIEADWLGRQVWAERGFVYDEDYSFNYNGETISQREAMQRNFKNFLLAYNLSLSDLRKVGKNGQLITIQDVSELLEPIDFVSIVHKDRKKISIKPLIDAYVWDDQRELDVGKAFSLLAYYYDDNQKDVVRSSIYPEFDISNKSMTFWAGVRYIK